MRVWASLAVLLLLVLDLRSATSDVETHLRESIGAMDRGDLSGAMSELLEARTLNPSSPDLYYRIGLLLGRTADFRGAEAAFRQAIELRRDFPEAHYNLGLTLIANPQSKLDWPAAIAEFRLASGQRPLYAEALNYLGAGLLATGDAVGAIQELGRAIQAKPGLPEVHFNLALALEKQECPDGAEKEYKLALQLRREYPEVASALGKMLLHQGRHVEALTYLAMALRSNPDLADAHYALGRLLQAERKPEEANAEFDEAKALTQRISNAIQATRLTNEGLEAAARGEFASALEKEQQAVALKPDYGVPHHNLGLVLADHGDWNGAASQLIKAASLMPGNANPWFDLGRVLAHKGDSSGALGVFAFARRLAPSDKRISAEIARIESTARAGGHDSPTLPTPPLPPFGAKADTVAAHLAFVSELRKADDFVGVLGELLRALALEPGHLEARQQLASAYERLGRTVEARLEHGKLSWISPKKAVPTQ